ncbi:MAG: exodeoxyribonuclease VII small subunit [Planctomycetota bacterium]
MAGKSKRKTFDEAMKELEAIVGELESGELGLEEAIRRYESGVAVLKECHRMLGEAGKKIEILTKDEDGNLRAAPGGALEKS